MFLILWVVLLATPAWAQERPFWTEQAMFTFGEDLFFVGQSPCVADAGAGRQQAFVNAMQELLNYLQVSTTEGMHVATQMTHEEPCETGGARVWRLVRVSKTAITELRQSSAPVYTPKGPLTGAAALGQRVLTEGHQITLGAPTLAWDVTVAWVRVPVEIRATDVTRGASALEREALRVWLEHIAFVLEVETAAATHRCHLRAASLYRPKGKGEGVHVRRGPLRFDASVALPQAHAGDLVAVRAQFEVLASQQEVPVCR